MSENGTVSVGVVGPGFIGAAHIEALRRLGFVKILGTAASNQRRAEEAAIRLGIPRAYRSYQEMIEDPSIGVIHNCTPNHLHLEINLAALDAAKHVVSEKPLAINAQETERLLERARAPACSGLVTAVNFCYRYYPMVQEMRAMVRRGDLGRIYLVHGSYCQDWLLYDTDYNWRIEPELGGSARVLGDIGSHWCDMAEYVTGMRITRVVADAAIVIPTRKKPGDTTRMFQTATSNYEEVKVTTEDLAGVLMVFDSGARGALVVSQVSAGRKNRLEIRIDGSERSVAWNQEESNVLWIGERNRPNRLLLKDPHLLTDAARAYAHYPGGHNEGYPDINKNLFANVYAAIKRRGETSSHSHTSGVGSTDGDFPSFVDGHRAAVIIDAIVESCKNGEWVRVGKEEPC
ncbi:MAG: Gfo/Idh/MocA family oxidoreductase [Bacillota bacterium]